MLRPVVDRVVENRPQRGVCPHTSVERIDDLLQPRIVQFPGHHPDSKSCINYASIPLFKIMQ